MAYEVSEAVMSGDERRALTALRDKLAAAIDDEETRPSDLPPLVLRLVSVLDRLSESETVRSPLDEVAARRDARRAAPESGSDSSGLG